MAVEPIKDTQPTPPPEFAPQQEFQSAPAPEVTPEQTVEAPREQEAGIAIRHEGFLDETIDSLKQKLRLSRKPKTTPPKVRDELTVNVEKILEEGIADAFKALPTVAAQQEFKIKGEETAWEIRQLLKDTHVKVKKIFRLILDWLRLLPGVNKFFLEQEAKIKADRIMAIRNRDRYL